MEYRKLIRFGNSAHVISLPTSWIKKNKLKKGNLVYFEENGNGELILSPKEITNNIQEKEITIDVTGSNYDEIRRQISTAYINNYRIINIIGDGLSQKSQNIKKILQNLMSMEVMEQTSKYIMAKDFLDLNTISIDNIIRKIDVITRSLITDSKLSVKENNYEDIYQRDWDVNRLSFLIFRKIKFAFDNPQSLKNLNVTPLGLLGYWNITNHLEKIADEAKRVSRFVTRAKLKNKRAFDFINLYSKIESCYIETMKVYYNKDREAALKLTTKKLEYVESCDKYLDNNINIKWVPNLVERLKIMINEIHSILKVVYEVYE